MTSLDPEIDRAEGIAISADPHCLATRGHFSFSGVILTGTFFNIEDLIMKHKWNLWKGKEDGGVDAPLK